MGTGVTSQRYTADGIDHAAYDAALAKLMRQYVRRGMDLAEARQRADGYLSMYTHHFRRRQPASDQAAR